MWRSKVVSEKSEGPSGPRQGRDRRKGKKNCKRGEECSGLS